MSQSRDTIFLPSAVGGQDEWTRFRRFQRSHWCLLPDPFRGSFVHISICSSVWYLFWMSNVLFWWKEVFIMFLTNLHSEFQQFQYLKKERKRQKKSISHYITVEDNWSLAETVMDILQLLVIFFICWVYWDWMCTKHLLFKRPPVCQLNVGSLT